ncbi:hypothetical protein DPMN_060407 [Dreissena polymorpha]|uniref:Uncharacterized protein n=1 Tax=Dreissena polymorpha TaxID=45954 RepID=A0A9D4C5Y1_DREPO|nr:hypothetical protein DPMN_060407 [Dreissena polymorpha]
MDHLTSNKAKELLNKLLLDSQQKSFMWQRCYLHDSLSQTSWTIDTQSYWRVCGICRIVDLEEEKFFVWHGP